MLRRAYVFSVFAVFALLLLPAAVRAGTPTKPTTYVILWFDTEDYILPASDDAALHIANFLTSQKIQGTFKVVGEKARTLERRGRTDVIEALKKHEIGYHSNFHSVEPTPAVYLNALGWDDGVAEFDRRERPGFDDVERIFGKAPTCYGQPGSSWAPQTLGAIKQWGMKVYLDAGRHVGLDGKPFYYCGLLNIYQITNMPRADLKNPNGGLVEAEDKFQAARKQLQAEGGGLVSIIYHPCEFAHKEFWDGVNFRNGANPPRSQWKLPAAKTPEETRAAFEMWESYIQFMRHFDDVKFITASDAVRLYADAAYTRSWSPTDVKTIAAAVGDDPGFQQRDGYTLSAGEVIAMLSEYVAARTAGREPNLKPTASPYGPSSPEVMLEAPISVDRDQFLRSTADAADSIHKLGRIPSAVWLGSRAVPPEAFLRSLALVAVDLADGKEVPTTIEIKPTTLASVKYVADDNPGLWKWVIFPPNFHAPNVMALAKREAWTLKPALLNDTAGE
jgi:hypothetical protein